MEWSNGVIDKTFWDKEEARQYINRLVLRAGEPDRVRLRLRAVACRYVASPTTELGISLPPLTPRRRSNAFRNTGSLRFMIEQRVAPTTIDPYSVRYIQDGGHYLALACRRGDWDEGRKTCRTEFEVQSVFHPVMEAEDPSRCRARPRRARPRDPVSLP